MLATAMNADTGEPLGWRGLAARSWPLLIGLLALYGPTFHGLATGIWSTDEQAHGPIILAIAAYLFAQKRDVLLSPDCAARPIAAFAILAAGLLFYVVGRSQDILLFEVGSLIWVLAALVLLRGASALKALWFPLFFMVFMLPLPSAIVDAITLPLKTAVSYAVEQVLFWAGYPIARSGVILQIGQYKLLVADACAGLHTLFTLEALGLLYLNIVRHDSLFRNVALALLVVPISFGANVIRVIALTLITYHLGDDAGQGFLHGFAGLVLFVTALILILGVDSLLQLWVKRDQYRAAQATSRGAPA
jgi:exosortase B